MDELLIQILKDKYTPVDLVDKLDISMDDFINHMFDYILDNLDKFPDEVEELQGGE